VTHSTHWHNLTAAGCLTFRIVLGTLTAVKFDRFKAEMLVHLHDNRCSVYIWKLCGNFNHLSWNTV